MTGNVVERAGAKRVFVDVDLASRNIDFAAGRGGGDAAQTKLLLPTHYNAPLDPDALDEFARRHKVRILEDAALAIGSRTSRGAVGATGDLVSFSFHPNKNMTTIEGGALVLNDEREARASWTSCASTASSACPTARATSSVPGAKYNFSDVSARLGLEQLAAPGRVVPRARAPRAPLLRAASRATTSSRPRRCRRATIPATAGTCSRCCCRSPQLGMTRKAVMDAMMKEGIGTGVSYEAIHLTTLFRRKGFREGMFPISERIARETLTLPLYPEMRETDVDRVCAALKRVLRRKAA